MLCAGEWGPDGLLRLRGRKLRQPLGAPEPALFWAAGLSFSRAQLIQEVSSDWVHLMNRQMDARVPSDMTLPHPLMPTPPPLPLPPALLPPPPNPALSQAPYPRHVPWLFLGEELLQLLRMWQRGWDVFTPSQAVAFHLWCGMTGKGRHLSWGCRPGWAAVACMRSMHF